jgi:toxin ParE1/3/4
MWRVRGFERYLIFYRPTDDGIDVVRVLHGSRDIESLFED